MSSNDLVLNRFFTKYIIEDLIENYNNQTYCSIIKHYLENEKEQNNGELISKIYKYMSKNYRNEYFYQNTLLNKLLLGRHSINTTTALTQVPIGKSKADFVLINGKAVVYEIKTELDNFDRLKTQITDYYKAFDHVCVVTCEKNYDKLNMLLDNTSVGICILTNKNTLQFKKESQINTRSLNHKNIFKILRKNEFENIILEYYTKLPKTTPVFYYDECYKWFANIPIDKAYTMTLKQLKKRNKVIKDQFRNVPYELKSLLYFYNATISDFLKLDKFLKEKYRG